MVRSIRKSRRPSSRSKVVERKRDPHARIKNAAVGFLVGNALAGRNGGLVGLGVGGIGNVGFFKGGKKPRSKHSCY